MSTLESNDHVIRKGGGGGGWEAADSLNRSSGNFQPASIIAERRNATVMPELVR